MSQGAVRQSASERKLEHEAKLQRQILDWITVVQPKRGDVLVVRVPDEHFIYPGTAMEDVSSGQRETMEACHKLMGLLVASIQNAGIPIGGAAIMAEGMTLESLPPPEPPIPVVSPRILLPPGTKV